MRKGFTLIEMVITVVVLGILSLFTFSFITHLTGTYMLMEGERRLHQEAAYAVDRISRELRDANQVFSGTGPELLFQRAHGTAVDNNGYVLFYRSGENIYRWSGNYQPAPPYPSGQPLGSNVTDFTTTYVAGTAGASGDQYQVSLTVSRGGATVTYNTTVCPKNYWSSSFGGRAFNGNYTDIVKQ